MHTKEENVSLELLPFQRLFYYVHSCREISIKGEGALLVVQSSISFLIIWFGKHDFFQQLSLELIDNCISVIIIL